MAWPPPERRTPNGTFPENYFFTLILLDSPFDSGRGSEYVTYGDYYPLRFVRSSLKVRLFRAEFFGMRYRSRYYSMFDYET